MNEIKQNTVHFTSKALEMVKNAFLQESDFEGVRIAVTGGGCAGMGYAMDFEKTQREGDEIYEIDGLKFFIDFASRQYLKGTEVDFIEGVHGSGFKFNNPNSITRCSCSCSH